MTISDTVSEGVELDDRHLPQARLIADQLCAERQDFDPKADAADAEAWMYARNGAWLALSRSPPSQGREMEVIETAVARALARSHGLGDHMPNIEPWMKDARTATRAVIVAMNARAALGTAMQGEGVREALDEGLLSRFRGALRFAASHSCISAADEKALLAALRASQGEETNG